MAETGRKVIYELRYRTDSALSSATRFDTALKKTDSQFKKTSSATDRLRQRTVQLTDAQKRAGSSFVTANKQVKTATGSMNKLGSAISGARSLAAGLGVTFGGLMIARAIQNWTKEAIEFSSTVRNVTGDLRFLGEETAFTDAELRTMFGNISVATGVEGGIRNVAEAYDGMITTEWRAIEASEELDDIMSVIATRGHDTGDAIDVVSFSMRNFDKDAGDAYEILSKADMAAVRGHISFSDLAKSAGRVGDKVEYAGGTLEEFLALNQVLSRDESGRKMLSDLGLAAEMLSGQNERQAKVLKELGVENGTLFDKLKALKKAREDNANVLNELTGYSSNYNRILENLIDRIDELETAADDYSKAVKVMDKATDDYYNSQEYKLNRLGNQWELLKITVGSALSDIILGLEDFGRMTDAFSDLEFRKGQKIAGEYVAMLEQTWMGYEPKFKGGQKKVVGQWIPGGVQTAPGGEEEEEEEKPPAGGGAPARPLAKDAKEAVDIYSKGMTEIDTRMDFWMERRFEKMTTASVERLKAEEAAEKALQEKRMENARAMGDFMSDTFISAISGGDVLGAIKNVFFDQLGSFVSMALAGALGGIGGAGGGFLSSLPFIGWFFDKGGIFDPVRAQHGRVFRPRPGGYLSIFGESSTRGEALVPNSIYGKELLVKHVLPEWFPELVTAEQGTIYGAGNGGQTPPINVEVPVLIRALDPQRLTAARTVKQASHARARTQG